MENPSQVTLIRGNHESSQINQGFGTIVNLERGVGDPNFAEFLGKQDHCDLLDSVYETLTLALFMGEKSASGQAQYTMFTHGLFELHADPHPLLQSQPEHAKMPVSRVNADRTSAALLSHRVKTLHFSEKADYKAQLAKAPKSERKRIKQEWAAQRIRALAKSDIQRAKAGLGIDNYDLTAFNWGDMQNAGLETWLGSFGDRRWKMAPADVKHYMRLISSPGSGAKVKLVFRGHEHLKQHHMHEGKVVVTTLPVGMDSPYKDRFPRQLDTAYLLTTGPKVKGWTKQALLREPGASVTLKTDLDGITSSRI
jgi:hypothetical protein